MADTRTPKALFDSCIALAERITTQMWVYATPGFLNRHGLDRDDLRQVALIAMWKAASNYDPTRGAAFTTVAGTYVKYALRDLVHRLKTCRKRQPATPFSAVTGPRAGDDATGDLNASWDLDMSAVFSDCREPDPLDEASRREEQRLVDAWVARSVTGRDREIVECRLAGMTFLEIGERYGVCLERARQIVYGRICDRLENTRVPA